jgi:nucleotide-binding universal stress UspA family protein
MALVEFRKKAYCADAHWRYAVLCTASARRSFSMLHTILVPLDGTPFGELAMPYARRLAELSRARLVLLKAAPYHALTTAGEARRRLPVDDARMYLEGWRLRLVTDGIEADVDALHTVPAHDVRFSARLRAADLIVMSTQGRSGLGRAFLGSISEEVLRAITAPMFLVRPGSVGWPARGPRSVLVPLDGSATAERVLPVIEQLNLNQDTVLHFVRAVSGVPADARSLVMSQGGAIGAQGRREARGAGAEARSYLEARTTGLGGRWPVKVHLCQGEASSEILRISERECCDVIAMTTKGRSGHSSSAFGSVFLDVVHASQAPVLAVHC